MASGEVTEWAHHAKDADILSDEDAPAEVLDAERALSDEAEVGTGRLRCETLRRGEGPFDRGSFEASALRWGESFVDGDRARRREQWRRHAIGDCG